MPAAPSDVDRARRALEQVLASPGFSRNPRLSRFLKFIADQHLEGNGDRLKESVIAVEVFGRNPDHDPSHDSIVRTEASRLRARLAEYYLEEGKDDAFLIELPKGGYRPVFRSREQVRPATPPLGETHRRIPLIAALVGSVVFLGMLGWWWSGRQSTPVAIAVLPLENLNHDAANDYFADGITDELIRNLSLIDGLSPRSRTSSFAFKGKSRSLREVGKELEVDYIVEGSVLRIGRQLRIDVQLVRVRDDIPVWSGRYDPALTDVLAIQDEVARGIVNGLRLKLARGRRRYETSVEAYDLYLRARALGIQQGLEGEIQSVTKFKESIAGDPTFAPAYAGLAAAYIARSGAEEAMADSVAEAQAAAQKALELDPLLAEAHGALAMVYARQGQWQRSEKSFRRAIELDPHDSVTFANLALSLLMPLGRVSEAVAQLRIATKNDPLAPRLRFILANALMAVRRFDEAVRYCQDLPADFPDKSVWLARARIGQGRVPEAIRILEDGINRGAASDDQARGFLGYAYGRADRRSEAERMAAETSNPYNWALTFAGLGDKQRTFEALERMAVLGPVRLGRDLTYPEFDLVRGDPRLKQFRNRIGLP